MIDILSVGCTPTPAPVVNAVVNVTFTGEGCELEGPEFLKTGPATLNFFNEGDKGAAMNTVKLEEGETFEDIDEQMGDSEGPFFGHAPEWTEELGTFHWITPGESTYGRVIWRPGSTPLQLSDYQAWVGLVEGSPRWNNNRLTR